MNNFFYCKLRPLKNHRGALIGLGLISFFIILATIVPWFTPSDPAQIFSGALKLKPFTHFQDLYFILGTDDIGRDVFTRIVHGARISLFIGLFVVMISATIGTLLGLFAGFYGSFVDRAIMRITDILMAFPSILLAITVISVLGPGLMNAILAVSIVAIPNFTRLVRASVLEEKHKCYVDASRSFGASDMRIIFKEIFPNCVSPLIVQSTLTFSDGILNAAALGFLGLGAQPPTPEWGTMLADARPYIESSPWLVTLPGLCILFTVLGLNLFGDGLRDILDPRLKN